jgi:opacity protein-like surface antigen
MKKITLVVLCLALLSISGVAHAGKKTGPYIGGSLGWAVIDVSSGINDFDDDDLGFKVFGGYNFGVIPLLDLAVEGSYANFGKASSSQIANQDVDITGWDLFGLAALNLGPVGLFGKVGQIWWDSDSNIAQMDDSGNDMAYGLGLRFQIGSIAIRGEYEYFDLDDTDLSMLSAGVSWTF